MAKQKWNETAVIRGALRRAFSRSPVVREVMMVVRREVPKFNKGGERSKKDAVQYLCAGCGNYVSSTKVAVDHIIPVISVEDGLLDWNTFKERLFCDKSNLQVLCRGCHDVKTSSERVARLYKKYMEELDDIEQIIQSMDSGVDKRKLIKILSKYRAKKKVTRLENVVIRANELITSLK